MQPGNGWRVSMRCDAVHCSPNENEKLWVKGVCLDGFFLEIECFLSLFIRSFNCLGRLRKTFPFHLIVLTT